MTKWLKADPFYAHLSQESGGGGSFISKGRPTKLRRTPGKKQRMLPGRITPGQISTPFLNYFGQHTHTEDLPCAKEAADHWKMLILEFMISQQSWESNMENSRAPWMLDITWNKAEREKEDTQAL